MRRYIRNRMPGGCYFFTLTLADRSQRYLTDYLDAFRDTYRDVRRKHPFQTDAIVILPDHLHCIWTLPPGDDNYPTRWFLIKSGFSRRIPKGERQSDSRKRNGERGIWQRRYWEHTIRDDDDYSNHVDYIHYNPIKHGLVTNLNDWPYSSFHRYVRKSIYTKDWSVRSDMQNMDINFD